MYDPLHSDTPGSGQNYPASYWSAVSGAQGHLNPLSGDIETEVAIIGAGYAGLSAAYFLAKEHQVETVVLEANRVGWGASGRNAGFALQSTGRLGASAMARRWDEETAKRVISEFRSGIEAVENFLSLGKEDCDRTENGFLKVIHSASLISETRAAEESGRRRFGVQSRFVEKEELNEKFIRSPGALAAVRYELGFCLNPLKYAHLLHTLAAEAGAKVYTGNPVTGWTKEGSFHVLHTPSGKVRAKQVVCAGNAYTPKNMHPALSNRTLPVLTSVIVTDPIPSPGKSSATGLFTRQGIMDTRKLKYYYRKLPDNRILFGGRGAIRGKDAEKPVFRKRLLAALHRDFPDYSELRIDYHWHGWITISLDDVPRIATSQEDATIHYASGYSGCGMAYTSQAGKRLAEKVVGQTRDHQIPILNSELRKFPLPWLKRTGQFAYYQYGRLYDWIR